MNPELWSLELDSLKTLYAAETKKLTEALLHGADWNETVEGRRLITQLSIIIDRKTEDASNSAEHSND